MAARQHLDAARPVARLLVERRPCQVESKYSRTQQTSPEVLSPTQSLDIPDENRTGSSDDAYDSRDENGERKEIDDDDEEAKVCL